jgi:ribosomal protein L7/L12
MIWLNISDFLSTVLIVLGFYLYSQFEEYRRRDHFLEVKIDALIKHTGIKFDDRTLLAVEVHQAIKAGQRLKAIRLYRKITGAGLKEASEIVDSFVKNT